MTMRVHNPKCNGCPDCSESARGLLRAMKAFNDDNAQRKEVSAVREALLGGEAGVVMRTLVTRDRPVVRDEELPNGWFPKGTPTVASQTVDELPNGWFSKTQPGAKAESELPNGWWPGRKPESLDERGGKR
jgi:hypothetical protein